jgi:hypothetical protein
MNKFEYKITKHPSEEFKKVVYFCSDEGQCNIDQLPADQLSVMEEIMNERGLEGWELIQLSFGDGGIIAFWKRSIA